MKLALSLPRARPHAAEQRSSWAAARAYLDARRLDRDLAAGVPPWRGRPHAARAARLTADRERAGLAERLERLLLRARYPGLSGPRLSVLWQPACGPVLGCDRLITDLAATLRADTPVSAEGVARLRLLLSGASAPLYRGDAADQFEAALIEIAELI